jgi:diketogulonate reductase-like aldo/keto reductase
MTFDAVIPIPGSRSIARVEENVSSAELVLEPDDVKAIRKLCESADVQGGRYPEGMTLPDGDCIELDEWKGE